MTIDLAKIQKGIEEGFKAGDDDDVTAKKLGITIVQATNFRTMLGLTYRTAINVFEESKALMWDDNTERFKVQQFSIPPEVQEKLKLKDKQDYSFFASVVKPMTIQITFLQRE